MRVFYTKFKGSFVKMYKVNKRPNRKKFFFIKKICFHYIRYSLR